jgi:hypothetical protein
VSKTLRDRIPGFYSINVHAIDPVNSSPRVQPSAAFFSIGGGLFAIVPSISQLWLPAMPSPSAVEKYLAYKKKTERGITRNVIINAADYRVLHTNPQL